MIQNQFNRPQTGTVTSTQTGTVRGSKHPQYQCPFVRNNSAQTGTTYYISGGGAYEA